MNSKETQQFAERLMKEVWEPYGYSAVERSDPGRYAGSAYRITDIAAEDDKFAIRFIYTAATPDTGEPIEEEEICFYHPKGG